MSSGVVLYQFISKITSTITWTRFTGILGRLNSGTGSNVVLGAGQYLGTNSSGVVSAVTASTEYRPKGVFKLTSTSLPWTPPLGLTYAVAIIFDNNGVSSRNYWDLTGYNGTPYAYGTNISTSGIVNDPNGWTFPNPATMFQYQNGVYTPLITNTVWIYW